MAEAIEAQLGGTAGKVETIQNWAMLEEVSPVPKEDCALVNELGLQSKFVVLYAGNMGPLQDIESIVGAAKLFAEEGR